MRGLLILMAMIPLGLQPPENQISNLILLYVLLLGVDDPLTCGLLILMAMIPSVLWNFGTPTLRDFGLHPFGNF
jgi:hypothetical protein